MTRGQIRFFFAIIAIAAIVLIGIWIKSRYTDALDQVAIPSVSAGTGEIPDGPGADDQTPSVRPRAKDPTTQPQASSAALPRITQVDRARAAMLFEKGLELVRTGQLLPARASLADALNSNALTSQQADTARAQLSELADKTLFSRQALEDDPCTGWYVVQPGEVLVKVERKLELRVPTQLILRINRISDATKIQAGQRLKIIRGPFHAAVSKSRYTMDVYLEEPQTKRMIFVRRFRVGTGKDGSTPAGKWRAALGGKIVRAPWTPPSSASLPRKTIRWGEPGYPLGKEGYWISLEGIEGTPYTIADGYGIHGTGDPTSIGRASSMGCIRLPGADMALLFAMLYEHWSTVTISP